MTREELIKIIQDNTMDSVEVAKYLGISRQRLSSLNTDGKLVAVKKGIYLKKDVEERKRIQGNLREKFLRK
ncbi:MAG: DNA-binding protein [Clostridium sporogenes]|nr:DNA-binding protein [Clostridium sporogenes]